ncbi:helix-turn-helix domain-containing protein [Caulobacter mirabilis]|uniref:HTH araC/xylS-type domain-containing protein n=1 Tax=Caulobacter mirabilis TaxID=69666 RepID=A0A2D2AUC0_9CAUL|nr:helix-turn-helix domain-containing protein [Caulobacter mirabilis]ATQ41567.1 hypothetical protein CSW64_03640 [Caulobacter mirabilis]
MTSSAPKPAGWSGDLDLGDGWAVWRGAVGDAAIHRHLAAQAVFAPEPIAITDAEGRTATGCCVLVDPLVAHRLGAHPHAELVFVEPARRLPPSVAERLEAARSAGALVLISAPQGPRFWARWLAEPDTPAAPSDPRIAAALEAIETMIADGPASLAAAAKASGLSSERFRHRFADQVGVPFRRYVQWRRLRLAAAALSAGEDATRAAHTAGFADSAHFARTLKATFGVTAGQALTRSR